MKIIQKTLKCKAFDCIPARLVLGLLCSAGVMELYMTRSNFSMAIVAMVRITSLDGGNSTNGQVKTPYCLRLANDTNENYSARNDIKEIPPIEMTTTERGNVLSAFFYAYGLSGILGGRLAEIYGTKKVFGVGVLVDAIGNFLIPVSARIHYVLLFFIRFTMGFFQGACYPSLHSLTAKWIPPKEAPKFVGFVYVSNSFGTIFTLTVCGIIISDLGWEAVFYICGSISLVWVVVWTILMHDTPDEHPRITEEEKKAILKSLSINKIKRKVPWLKMITSLPLWAIHVAHAGNMLGLSFLLTQLPIYMSSILGTNFRNNGLLSSLPFLARFLGSNFFSWTGTFFLSKFNLRPKIVKVVLTIIGFGGPGVCLVLVGYIGCNTGAVTALMIIGMFCNGASNFGYATNHLDIAPNFAGTALGMSSLVGFLYAMIGPVLVGALTKEEVIQEWITVYWIVFANYVITGGIYILFMSTYIQPWNDGDPQENNKIEPAPSVKIVNPIENEESTNNVQIRQNSTKPGSKDETEVTENERKPTEDLHYSEEERNKDKTNSAKKENDKKNWPSKLEPISNTKTMSAYENEIDLEED